LIALLLPLTRRLAAQNLMLNAVTRASYADPARAVEPRIWWANIARHLDYRGRLAGVAAPALIIVGRHDPQTPVACAEELAAGLPRACLRRFEHSEHYPFIEEPERFWAEIAAFLQPPAESVHRHSISDGGDQH
jgi:pimeloyl-ACP methyl ester carboxylesterase